MARRDAHHSVAWFYSTYGAIFFQHEVLLHASHAADGTLRFSGEQDLGDAFGGLCRYEGTVAGDSFRAGFTAENGDRGVFEMGRVD